MAIIKDFSDDAKKEEYKNNPVKLTVRYIKFLNDLNSSDCAKTYKELVIGLEYMYYDSDFKLGEKSIFAKLASEMEYLKDQANKVLEAPIELVEMYNEIKGTSLLPLLETGLSQKVDEILTENNVPTLKEIFEYLDGKLDDGLEDSQKVEEKTENAQKDKKEEN